MYRANPLKRFLSGNETALGCWLHMASPVAAEIIALVGYDFVIIDHEHGPGHYLDATSLLHAVSATDTAALIRVPANDPVHLKRALDTGVNGVVIPMVENADDARRAVAGCLYPPAGIRGMAHVLCRASDYGLRADAYAERLGTDLTIMCMIESPNAVENIPAIGEVEHVDALFLGPFDLSCAMGLAGQFDHPDVAAMIAKAETAMRKTGKPMATIVTKTADPSALFARGYRLVVAGSDVTLLRDAAVVRLRDGRPPSWRPRS